MNNEEYITEKGNILITTIGRPTDKKYVKSKITTIERFNIKKVVGLLALDDDYEIIDNILNLMNENKENKFFLLFKNISEVKENKKNIIWENIEELLPDNIVYDETFRDKTKKWISDFKDNKVLFSIIEGWIKDSKDINDHTAIIANTHIINLKPFYNEDQNASKSIDLRNEQILEIIIKIIDLIDDDISGIIFDISSGRRILSPICINIAYFIKLLVNIKKINSPIINQLKIMRDNINVITRPVITKSPLITSSYKDISNKNKNKNNNRTKAKFNIIPISTYPLLSYKEIIVLKYWDTVDTHKNLAKKLKERNGWIENTTEKLCNKLQEKLEKHHFVDKNIRNRHPPLTTSGRLFSKMYSKIIENDENNIQ